MAHAGAPHGTGHARSVSRRGRTAPDALLILLAASIVLAGGGLPATAQPRLRLIATGGTIGNHGEGRLPAASLAASVPGLAAVARVEPETFASRASLALTLDDWLRLARRVRAALDEPGLTGVVVTAGTDTLEELAYFLDLTVPGERPVVVTGAMRRPGAAEADGPANLLAAALVATSAEARGRGVLVVFGGLILAADEVQKVSTSGPEAFASEHGHPLGRLEGNRVRFLRNSGRGRQFDISGVGRLPRVDLLWTYQQAPGDLIEAAVKAGAKGLVIAAAGAGALTAPQSAAVRSAVRRGVPVVVASRVEGGRVPAEELPRRHLLTAAGSMSPLKARILLMVALAAGVEPGKLEDVFR